MTIQFRVFLVVTAVAVELLYGSAIAAVAGKPQAGAAQPPLSVVQHLCLPGRSDYALQKWNFIDPWLLCSAGDQYTGGEVLFKRKPDGSFSQASSGGGDLPVSALEYLGVPSTVAKKLISGMHT